MSHVFWQQREVLKFSKISDYLVTATVSIKSKFNDAPFTISYPNLSSNGMRVSLDQEAQDEEKNSLNTMKMSTITDRFVTSSIKKFLFHLLLSPS